MTISISLAALLFPLVSHHYMDPNAADHFREVNPGILAEVQIDGATYEAGAYANSVYRTTITVQRRFSAFQAYGVDAGVRLGICTGYRYAVIPCGGASVRLGSYIDLTFVPPVHNYTPAVTALTFRLPL